MQTISNRNPRWWLNNFLWGVCIIGVTGCTPTVDVTPTVLPATMSQEPSAPPTLAPSFTPTLLQAFTPTFVATQTLSQTVLKCVAQREVYACEDPLLQIAFEYPASLGKLSANLSEGDTGYAYDYHFGGRPPTSTVTLEAGGRSANFTAGRGGFLTDFAGFAETTLEKKCVRFNAALCWDLQPDVVFMIALPQATYVCDPGPGIIFWPTAIIALDFPERAFITGFVFIAEFLSDELHNELLSILDTNPNTGKRDCTETNMRAFDSKVGEIKSGIEMNTLDERTEQNLDQLLQLANSVTFINP
jgi:hypothetical protein